MFHSRPELFPLFTQMQGRKAWDDKIESTRIYLTGVHALKALHRKEVQSSACKFSKRVEASITSNNSKLKLDIHLKNSGD